MIYPLIRELGEGGIPVTVTCRVLNMARQAYYRWSVDPMYCLTIRSQLHS